MYKIYFENRCIYICSEDDTSLSDANSVLFYPSGNSDITTLVEMFRQSDSPDRIYIPSESPETMYKRVCSEFVEVMAAGGLVRSRRGDFLLIKRNGLWDLPKGHMEEGEDIRTTAVREVQEETGVDELELGDLICITDHCYFRNGKWHLKHSWWYNMLYNKPVDLTPQTEEDITKAVWVAKSSLPPLLVSSYPSIREVFREAGI